MKPVIVALGAMFTACLVAFLFIQKTLHEPTPAPLKGANQELGKSTNTDKNAKGKIGESEGRPAFIKIIPADTSPEDQHHKTYEHKEKPALDRWLSYGTISLAVFTLFLFGVTVVLAWYTFSLWDDSRRTGRLQGLHMRKSLAVSKQSAIAAKESADVARESLEQMKNRANTELRAYVAVKSAFLRLTSTATNSRKILGKITIVNAGKTPAKNVKLAINVDFFPEETGVFEPAYRDEQTYILPNFEWNVAQQSVADVDDALRDLLINKARFVIMWGEISYDDVFGTSHISKFRFKQGMFINAPTSTGWESTPCKEGNDAT